MCAVARWHTSGFRSKLDYWAPLRRALYVGSPHVVQCMVERNTKYSIQDVACKKKKKKKKKVAIHYAVTHSRSR